MRSRWLLLIGVLGVSACQDRAVQPTPDPSSAPAPSAGSAKGATTPGVDEPGAADVPYVRGSVVIVGPWKEERLAVGFAGQGADGKPHSNMAANVFTPDEGAWAESLTFKPQITSLDSRGRANPEYRHTRMPPGEYVVYVHRGGVPAAWKRVTVKPGDRQTVDLTIDPAKTGTVTVTLPDAEANEPSLRPLLLIPADIDLPGTAWHDAFRAADVMPGDKLVSATGVPAGKYRVSRDKSRGEVEVMAGQTAAVTLVRDEPKTK